MDESASDLPQFDVEVKMNDDLSSAIIGEDVSTIEPYKSSKTAIRQDIMDESAPDLPQFDVEVKMNDDLSSAIIGEDVSTIEPYKSSS
ncbi:hypothetical protein KIN20_024529 [Parelaphostrongylus tenuis]|uniref:Uncharacterized protein n=1 Tax=Parelaphostrongylus tenuis TaxID=148309 RepID=A0AAD5N7P2_PARTN|nr:hypothetical protein KIN20_024529 [Parelaphostrongylus tenuis]